MHMDSVTWELKSAPWGWFSQLCDDWGFCREELEVGINCGSWNNVMNYLIIWGLVHHHVWHLCWEPPEPGIVDQSSCVGFLLRNTVASAIVSPSLSVKVNNEKAALFCFGQSLTNYALSLQLHCVGWKWVKYAPRQISPLAGRVACARRACGTRHTVVAIFGKHILPR